MTVRQCSPEIAREVGDRQVVRAVTVIIGVVVGLTFVFGFGNVLSLALRLGVPVWVAPLVAPTVDLSVLALLLASRHLAMCGASREQLQPARRLLIFSSLVTLALNVADPLVAGQFGKAAFDAVGPLLLIGWAEVGPGLLRAVNGMAAGVRVDVVVEDVASDDRVVVSAGRLRHALAVPWSHRRQGLSGRLTPPAVPTGRIPERTTVQRPDHGCGERRVHPPATRPVRPPRPPLPRWTLPVVAVVVATEPGVERLPKALLGGTRRRGLDRAAWRLAHHGLRRRP